MRTCLAISVVVHAALMLWLWLAPGARSFGPANAEPIMVDLLPPQDAPAAAEQEPAKSERPKAEEAKAEPVKSEPPRPAPGKPAPPKSEAPKSEALKPGVEDAAQERAETAARLAWVLNLPTDTVTSLAAPPSENKSNLASQEIAEFKAQVSKCWVVPAGVPSTPGFDVLIRIALKPDGTLGAAPELIRAPASLAGPPLVDSAKQALRKCQPYGALPADKYKDWKILDLTFTAQGPSGLSGPPAGKSAAQSH
jgi:hypothetical protein